MTGSVPVIANPLPSPFDVTGGGTYCLGSAGRPIFLSFSSTGITYQLKNGTANAGSPIPGTGGPLSFGNQTVDGLYTVVATNTSTGCTNTMNYSATIAGKGLPDVENVIGGGHFCAGTAGPVIKVSPSQVGIDYQLYMGTTPIGAAVTGTGLDLSLGNPTVAGTYIVVATDPTTLCTSNMNGSATVVIDPLPNAWLIGGGGNYCNGASGRNITLSSSNTGITYYLMHGVDTVGVQGGTGTSIDFGAYSVTGVYTAFAINNTTGCMRNMIGVSSIGLNPLPTQFNVTGTGNYCAGSTGQLVGLDFSNTGITYQLYRGGTTPVGSPVTGTGAPLSFGSQTITGTYTVIATNTSTSCVNTMAGNAVVGINALPTLHLVTGGGSYCSGGTGVNVNLNGSDLGINYQLFLGLAPVGSVVAGTGSPISFGQQTAGGNYTVMATDATSLCSRFMVGNANVVVNALPTPYSITGGGIYCNGGAGLHVGLSGSAIGIKYQLYNNGVPVGSLLTGSGGAIDFGAQAAQGTYTAVGNNAVTGCSNAMSSSTVIATQPLPTVYAVTGGGAYCAGGSGFDVSIANSDPGIDYQLYHGSALVGAPLGGIGSSLSFGTQTAAGNYTVIATDGTTGCIKTMGGSAVISINPLPTAHTVLGGGNYCTGGTGVHIFLGVSNPGVSYQLYNGSTPVGGAMSGTGSTLDFGLNTATGTYTVAAMNTGTGCSNNMTGTATVGINPLPSDFMVTGGGSYCLGGGGVTVGLAGSESGVRYQLSNGSTAVGLPITGSGSSINFGPQTAAGTYTVYAVNSSTTCANAMTTSASISINPLPTPYSVTGGGNYCATGIGVHVNLANSETGINYQVYYGGSAVGVPVAGTGGALDLGLQTAAGVYTVMASNGTTSCADAMTGSTIVNIIPVVLPGVNITPSTTGVICADQLIHFTATPVNGGSAPTYQWTVNGIATGVGSSYNYIPVDGDVVSARIHSNAQCAIPDTGSGRMTMTVSPLEMPSATVSANPGSVVCTGALTSFTATTLYGDTSPVLTWLRNGVAVASGLSYAYIPTDGDVITFELGSNFNCRLADNVFSTPIALTVQNPVLPTVAVVSNAGTVVAPGQSVTFTATATHAGPAPMYQWVINSVPVHGATNATFTTNTLNNRDSVSCAVTGICDMVGFNSMIVSVRTTGVKQITSNGSDVKLIPNPNKGDFNLKGTLNIC